MKIFWNINDQTIFKISPISDEIKKLINDQNYLDKVLAEGANKAEEIAGKKIKEMKKIIGF